MRIYRFRFIEGSSAPFRTFEAKDDADFYIQLKRFLAAAPLRSLISGSIEYTESGRVPDPPLPLEIEREPFTEKECEIAERIGLDPY